MRRSTNEAVVDQTAVEPCTVSWCEMRVHCQCAKDRRACRWQLHIAHKEAVACEAAEGEDGGCQCAPAAASREGASSLPSELSLQLRPGSEGGGNSKESNYAHSTHSWVATERSSAEVKAPCAPESSWRPQYRNPWNYLRMGKLLEDLDSLAGSVAFSHWCGAALCGTPPCPSSFASHTAKHVKQCRHAELGVEGSAFAQQLGVMHCFTVSRCWMPRFSMRLSMVEQRCSDDGLADTRPPMLVTASVDAIHMRHQLSMDNDMMVEGRVCAAPLPFLTCTHEEPHILHIMSKCLR